MNPSTPARTGAIACSDHAIAPINIVWLAFSYTINVTSARCA
jgi:hypothetical protein